ncbi:SRA stem-loop-interacting RNA-binding protein, mitochondrial-like [Dendronephthya gigantea]|uniref:SRA stem-loop-interacting RNA-binding protein, mitochondrial-like n=1 Tax=Dendronephthya gigantea TaxID=151771 RepID=UPI0010694591|nr:SRA stem-loop-interacting RNA-binding protein, mitochondrial-like [Dendronephthya gigantea]
MAAEEVRKLFVARLPWTACRVALREYFSRFGAVERSQVLFDQNTGRSKRFGFVVFKDEESIAKTMKASIHEIHDTEIFVQPHKPPKRKDHTITNRPIGHDD